MSKIEILPLYEDQARFADDARSTPQDEHAALYQRIVIDPHWQTAAANGEFIYLAQQAARPILQLDELAQAAQHLIADDDLHIALVSAFEKASAALPGNDVVVVVMACDPTNAFVRDQMNGIVGYAPGAGKIWLQINPISPNWRTWLESTFVHEYHHSLWTALHYTPFDLATYLIFEGRAESFVRALYPDRIAPWTLPLASDEEAAMWSEIQPLLNSTDWGVMSKYIFGRREGVPEWTGYRLGFKLVQQFINRHPTMPIAEWTALDAHDVIAESGYNGE